MMEKFIEDPDLIRYARALYRMGFCKNVICQVIGCTYDDFDRFTRDCTQGDKESLLDKMEL